MRIKARGHSAHFGRQVHKAEAILKFVQKWLDCCGGFLHAADLFVSMFVVRFCFAASRYVEVFVLLLGGVVGLVVLWALSCSKSEGVCETPSNGATFTMLYFFYNAGLDLVDVCWLLCGRVR